MPALVKVHSGSWSPYSVPQSSPVLTNSKQLCHICLIFKVKVLVTQSCPTLCNLMDSSLPGSSVHGILQARILGMDSHSLLQGIFLTQGSNPGLPHCRQILYCLSLQGSPYRAGCQLHLSKAGGKERRRRRTRRRKWRRGRREGSLRRCPTTY